MAATTEQVERLRLMTAEPTTVTYSDDTLKSIIERFPLADMAGFEPLLEDGTANVDWTATYDLHAAAAEVWQYKAGGYSTAIDFDADGGKFDASQLHKQAMEQVRFHLARRSIKMVRLEPQPKSVDVLGQ